MGRWPMTREDYPDRSVEIEHRLAWIEKRLGAPMSIVDPIIAAAAEKQWREQRRGAAFLFDVSGCGGVYPSRGDDRIASHPVRCAIPR